MVVTDGTNDAAAVTSAHRDGFAARPLEARGARRALPVAIALALASEKAFGDAIVRMRGVLEFTSAAGSPRSGGCLNSWLVSSCPIYAVLLLLLLLLFFSQSRHWTSISRGSRSTRSSR